MRTAFWMIVRRAQDRAQLRKTWLPSMQSSKPETKHSSAFVRSAVSKNESKCILSIFSLNTLQNSVFVAYNCDFSVGIGFLRGIVSFVLSDSPLRVSVNQGVSPGAQCLNSLLRTSGQNSFATLKNVSSAICWPHLFAVFPSDRSAAG